MCCTRISAIKAFERLSSQMGNLEGINFNESQ